MPLIFYLVWRATMRDEPFSRWNWRNHSERIRDEQLRGKLGRFAGLPPERVAAPLRISIAERLGISVLPDAVDPQGGIVDEGERA